MPSVYRPSGDIEWILNRLKKRKWGLIGALGTEDRCLAAHTALQSRGELGEVKLLEIEDSDQYQRYVKQTQLRRAEMRKRFLSAGGKTSEIEPHQLFERHHLTVDSIQRYLHSNPADVIVDISSLPKLFFFPILKQLLRSPTPNILVVYTSPEEYGTQLSEDFEAWRTLPSYMVKDPEPEDRIYIIGLGFSWMGLTPAILSPNLTQAKVQVMFPFPPGPPNSHRNWEAMQLFEAGYGRVAQPPIRVSAHDVSANFDHFIGLTNGGVRYAIFAPYGPKTMSLAMCLFAARFDSAVFYTQPKIYNPLYSRGVKLNDGKPDIHAFAIRLNGRDLY